MPIIISLLLSFGVVYADCDSSNWQESLPNLDGCDLEGADLYGIDFSYAVLDNANLSNANLATCDFTGASLVNANLSGANLWNTNFEGAFLCGIDVSSLSGYLGSPITEFDCFDVCGGSGSLDECGVCDGDGSACFGCTDPFATNYSELAIYDDGGCEYFQSNNSNPPTIIWDSFLHDQSSLLMNSNNVVVDYDIYQEQKKRFHCVESVNGDGHVVCADQIFTNGLNIEGGGCNSWEYTWAIYELDLEGEIVWYRETGRFGDGGSITCSSYGYLAGLVSSDNGYLVFGYASAYENVTWLLKLDAAGNQVWLKPIDYNSDYNRDTYVRSALIDSDGDIVLVGEFENYNGSNLETDAFVTFLTDTGDELATFSYDHNPSESYADYLHDVIESSDGEYFAVGRKYIDSEAGGGYQWVPSIMKFNQEGVIFISTIDYGALHGIGEELYLLELSNGNLLLYGQSSQDYALLIIVNSEGEYVSHSMDHQSFEISTGYSAFMDAIVTFDNKILLVGFAQNSFYSTDFLIAKLSQDMNFEWVDYYGPIFDQVDRAYSVFQSNFDSSIYYHGIGYNVYQNDRVPIIVKSHYEIGCMLNGACNYNPVATFDDGSCYYEDICDVCDGNGYDFCDDDNNGVNNLEQWGYGPYNLAATDIPDDQGGNILLTFDRSFYDTDTLQSRSEVYTIEILEGEQWYVTQSFGAYGADSYNVIVPTLHNNEETTFRVIANMDEGNYVSLEYTSGISVDNLAPEIPSNVEGVFGDGIVSISWNVAADNDFAYFNVYRNSDAYSTTVESTYIDTNLPEIAEVFYQISAIDVNGNESDLSDAIGVLICINGDMNEDYTLNVIDIVLVMEHILGTTPYEPGNCTTDLNSDGILDILDVVLLVNIILAENGGEE